MGPVHSAAGTRNGRLLGKNIIQQVKIDKVQEESLIKLLLLGAGESGKSTVLKQMKILHGNGFPEQYRGDMRAQIGYNIIEGAYAIVEAMEVLEIPFSNPATIERNAEVVRFLYETHSSERRSEITPDLAKAVQELIKDEGFRRTMKRSSEYQLQDSWFEFATKLENYPAWGGPAWIPNDDDILLARVRTTGVNKDHFKVRGRYYEMIDVGGQRAERRKYMHLFKGVKGVLFVTSLSEYDQTMFESPEENRLEDSVALFGNVATQDTFADSALLLFLNKFDLFQQKYYVDHIPLHRMPGFPDPPKWADEVDDNCAKAIAWYTDLYLDRAQRPKAEVFVHKTTAVNKANMSLVIDACATFVAARVLKETGLYQV